MASTWYYCTMVLILVSVTLLLLLQQAAAFTIPAPAQWHQRRQSVSCYNAIFSSSFFTTNDLSNDDLLNRRIPANVTYTEWSVLFDKIALLSNQERVKALYGLFAEKVMAANGGIAPTIVAGGAVSTNNRNDDKDKGT